MQKSLNAPLLAAGKGRCRRESNYTDFTRRLSVTVCLKLKLKLKLKTNL